MPTPAADPLTGAPSPRSRPSHRRTAVIVGAGPAGLTAAYELLRRTDVVPLVFEADDQVGGISKTVQYRGNRMDIGGHRFFSKSDRVMEWWTEMLPLEGAATGDRRQLDIHYHHRSRSIPVDADGPDPECTDDVMLVRDRLSRILYAGKFFDYPISLNSRTVANLGFRRMAAIGASYIRARALPVRPERSLEDFLVNRFGRELYQTFFRDYTEKVWGVPCDRLSAEWGAQRIKGLSVSTALRHALGTAVRGRRRGVVQRDVETSLIERFLYPKYGPGQMWEEVARRVTDGGGVVRTRHTVVGVVNRGDRIVAVRVRDDTSGEVSTHPADFVVSTMPVRHLIERLDQPAPANVRAVAAGLVYRDFVSVGLLVDRLTITDGRGAGPTGGMVRDNWIYIQEPDVKVGRLQIFNNWSPYLVSDPDTVWLGLEYFCDAGDDLWSMPDGVFRRFAAEELHRIGIIGEDAVLDGTVLRVPKAYPAYFGSYERFGEIREYTDRYPNLFLVGRNGMHRYNNQDHSMLTAMTAVDNIVAGIAGKENIWSVNTEGDYHEKVRKEQPQHVGRT